MDIRFLRRSATESETSDYMDECPLGQPILDLRFRLTTPIDDIHDSEHRETNTLCGAETPFKRRTLTCRSWKWTWAKQHESPPPSFFQSSHTTYCCATHKIQFRRRKKLE